MFSDEIQRKKKEKNAIPINRSVSALPPSVLDLADLLAEIAACQLRRQQVTSDRGGKSQHE